MSHLVHRLICSWHMAAGQLAVFQGASEAPISESSRSSEQLGKQPTGRGPEGCVENGPAAALLVGYLSIQICALLAPCRRPIFNATRCQLHMRRCTSARNDLQIAKLCNASNSIKADIARCLSGHFIAS